MKKIALFLMGAALAGMLVGCNGGNVGASPTPNVSTSPSASPAPSAKPSASTSPSADVTTSPSADATDGGVVGDIGDDIKDGIDDIKDGVDGALSPSPSTSPEN